MLTAALLILIAALCVTLYIVIRRSFADSDRAWEQVGRLRRELDSIERERRELDSVRTAWMGEAMAREVGTRAAVGAERRRQMGI